MKYRIHDLSGNQPRVKEIDRSSVTIIGGQAISSEMKLDGVEMSALREAIRFGEAITMGKTIVEPVWGEK